MIYLYEYFGIYSFILIVLFLAIHRYIKLAHIEAPHSQILSSYLYQERFAVILEKVENFLAAHTFFLGINGHIYNSHEMKTVMNF